MGKLSAYELAEYWDNQVSAIAETTASMLRQQADRIAELEKTNQEMSDLYEAQLDKKADRIAELEKHYSQEEVDKVANKLREGSKDPNKWSNMMDEAMEMILTFQHRIAELEKQIEIFDAELIKSRVSNSLMKTDRDRLAKEISSKPVYWTEKDLMNACRNARLTEDDFLRIKAYLPLYTHPVKQLSDEYWKGFEAGKHHEVMKAIYNNIIPKPVKQLSDEEIQGIAEKEYGHAVGLYNHIGFARAIIKEITE